MKDTWATYRDHIALWTATIPLDRASPEALLDWMAALIESGEREQVYQVRSIPELGYRKADGEPLGAFLKRHFAETGITDLFGFDGVWRSPKGLLEIYSRVGYHDGDRLVEDDVLDLGAIVERTRPEIEPRSMIGHVRPLRADGFPINWVKKDAPMYVGRVPWTTLRFYLHTDIWLPWVWGEFVPFEEQARELYDNIELALHHTPRLNRFLQEARAQTLAIGGSWQLDQVDELRKYLRPQLSDDGIVLDCARPKREW